MRLLATMTAEGFTSKIQEDDNGRVFFTADADIDADGANGQHGQQAAYMTGNKGSEHLANGGMTIIDGRVVCAHEWARDIVILDTDGEPKVFPGGVIASKTWYRRPGSTPNDPAAYVDAEVVPYIVVPPIVVRSVRGIVRGCRAKATFNGKSVDCVVADRGPARKVGELSIAAARALGINPSPRNGGLEKPDVLYELWPGQAAPGFHLIPA